MDVTKENINLANIAFLQAYLIEVFSYEQECEKNFKHTEWYLDQKYENEEKELYLRFIKERGATCDCDVIKKIILNKEPVVKEMIMKDH